MVGPARRLVDRQCALSRGSAAPSWLMSFSSDARLLTWIDTAGWLGPYDASLIGPCDVPRDRLVFPAVHLGCNNRVDGLFGVIQREQLQLPPRRGTRDQVDAMMGLPLRKVDWVGYT